MIKIIKTLFTFLIYSLLFSGCTSQNNLPIYPTTGSEFTEIWKQYESYAKENNKPQLDFISTSKVFDKNKSMPSEYSDNFTNNDDEIYIFAKLSNVYGTPLSTIEVYEPSGQLYNRYKTQYTYNTGKWNIYTSFQIKDYPAEELNGIWKVKILLDNKLAYIKEFTINSTMLPHKINTPYQNIGVLPFWDSEKNKRKHSLELANFIARKLIASTTSKITIPTILQSEFSSPMTNYESFPEYLEKDLKSERSQLLKVAKKYNLDIIITGRTFDDGIIRKDKGVDVYVIDVKNKEVKEISRTTNATVTSHGMSESNIRKDLYSKVWQEFINKIDQ